MNFLYNFVDPQSHSTGKNSKKITNFVKKIVN